MLLISLPKLSNEEKTIQIKESKDNLENLWDKV